MESGASYHISGDKSSLPYTMYSQSLLDVTSANGNQTRAKGVGQANPLYTLNFVLYVPGCPFNLASVNRLTCALNCDILFFEDSLSCMTIVRDTQLV